MEKIIPFLFCIFGYYEYKWDYHNFKRLFLDVMFTHCYSCPLKTPFRTQWIDALDTVLATCSRHTITAISNIQNAMLHCANVFSAGGILHRVQSGSREGSDFNREKGRQARRDLSINEGARLARLYNPR